MLHPKVNSYEGVGNMPTPFFMLVVYRLHMQDCFS